MDEVADAASGTKEVGGVVWWGEFSLDVDHAGRWRVGPSTMWIERHDHEWRVTHWQEDDPMDAQAEINVPASMVLSSIPEDAEVDVGRYSFEETQSRLIVAPALADRPVIVRPEEPLFVLTDETVTLFVSTPLWMRLSAGTDNHLLTEIPSYRPSDSWFGPNTREGELCYASSTLGRLRLEDVPLRLHRAITPVIVRNTSGESLSVDRIRIPVEFLSLFQDDDGYLWTESVRFDKTSGDELAALTVGKGAPRFADGAKSIAAPRQRHDRGALVRAFSSLINRIADV